MSWLTLRRATLLAAVVAAAVYVHAARNGWAMDDVGVIQQNPVAHSIGAAWDAWFAPYWPQDEGVSAGQYRPLTILTYGIDWTLSNGSPAWFHLVNVALHAIATALVVLVVAAWLRPVGALVAGLVFAVHPVHVEAVANVVGRAEILAAVALLAALLLARRYRHAEPGRARAGWLAATVFAVTCGLFAKEHAVIAIVLLALDHLLDRRRPVRPAADLYLAVMAVTLAWLFLWRAVAGGLVGFAEAATLRNLTAVERLWTMLPTQLDLLRLLTLPLQLSNDYNPQVIPQRTAFTWLAMLGVIASAGTLALGVVLARRAPAITFAVLVAAASYAPTSNLLFASGVIFAERTLYLAVLAPAVVAGYLVMHASSSRWARAAYLACGALLLVYTGRTVTRTGFWVDNPNVVVEGVIQHPQSYRVHVQIGRVLERTGDTSGAIAEYLTAAALFDRDPFVPMLSAPLALEAGRPDVALAESRRAVALAPDHPVLNRLLVTVWESRGADDSAVVAARRAIERAPQSRMAAETYRDLVVRQGAPPWLRELAGARVDWLALRLSAATDALRRAQAALRQAERLDGFCWEVETLWPAVEALRPALAEEARAIGERADLACRFTAQ